MRPFNNGDHSNEKRPVPSCSLTLVGISKLAQKKIKLVMKTNGRKVTGISSYYFRHLFRSHFCCIKKLEKIVSLSWLWSLESLKAGTKISRGLSPQLYASDYTSLSLRISVYSSYNAAFRSIFAYRSNIYYVPLFRFFLTEAR